MKLRPRPTTQLEISEQVSEKAPQAVLLLFITLSEMRPRDLVLIIGPDCGLTRLSSALQFVNDNNLYQWKSKIKISR